MKKKKGSSNAQPPSLVTKNTTAKFVMRKLNMLMMPGSTKALQGVKHYPNKLITFQPNEGTQKHK
jgi:hypothetical protein